jgi:hypothetical protein
MFIVGVPWLLTKTVFPARWGLGRYRQDARVADFFLPEPGERHQSGDGEGNTAQAKEEEQRGE